MGSNVGRVLCQHDYRVITSLEGRSQRTRGLAKKAGMEDVGSLDDVVTQADIILCIIVPSESVSHAWSVARALRRTGASLYYADCNAVSPQTVQLSERIITDAGGKFIDASIIGGVPREGSMPRFYTSGAHANVMSEFDGKGILIRNVGDKVGQASGIKMCFAGMTKGTTALHIAILSAAMSLGLWEPLMKELEYSQGPVLQSMRRWIPPLPAKTLRWVGEMEEIAATYESLGAPSNFHHGAAEVYRILGTTPFAEERAETVDKDRTLEDTIRAFVERMDQDGASRE
jgi:3-hydroxyisobutyrate dehydrogenase-like beta-hydroxyacid dehydrogenase